jgi:hypothetical protein
VLNAVTKSWHILPALAIPQRVAICRSESTLMANSQTWTHSNAHYFIEAATGVEGDSGQEREEELYSLCFWLTFCLCQYLRLSNQLHGAEPFLRSLQLPS